MREVRRFRSVEGIALADAEAGLGAKPDLTTAKS